MSRGRAIGLIVLAVLVLTAGCRGPGPHRAAGRAAAPAPPTGSLDRFPLPSGSGPHDVAPAPDGSVWYTAQAKGALGRLDPVTGRTTEIPLGKGSAPHGVIVGPDGAAWVTDPGLNAVLRVDPVTSEVKRFALPAERPGAAVHTATFDRRGILWFTGNAGVYGRLDDCRRVKRRGGIVRLGHRRTSSTRRCDALSPRAAPKATRPVPVSSDRLH